MGISARTWARLSDREKQWLGAFKAASPQLTEMILGAEQALLGKLEAAGLPVYRPDAGKLAALFGAMDDFDPRFPIATP